ncbi:protein-disulfide reductase DsbD [Shewanella sp. C32]|uniref:Thiol:disulfide interchange protein DsbD n=1 Tax=Shewanella electrica TaxID=515560 RepID=A0ABT2FMI0_9GAMM|nr:protein-disulfide reductase DsbD [Shewanella electrica]MCH1926089.1 protein-disulfide reductase DsbD [Shewanella electrica]MCS4557542.1 protein-disulfide reductase DsbD [Shewanella electrica]
MKRLLPLLLGVLVIVAGAVQADNSFAKKFPFLTSEPELMPVEKAFAFEAKQDGNKVTLSWVIADGYYMYRDKLNIAVSNAELGDIAKPVGEDHHDDYFGNQAVYRTYIEIPVALKQAAADGKLSVTFMGCAEGKLCFPPTTRDVDLTEVAANDGVLAGVATDAASADTATSQPLTEQDSLLQQLVHGDSWLLTLLSFFVLGIGLALTPCVFPMYPILSGIIVGQGGKVSTARAFTLSMTYVQGMAITYSVLGLIVATAGMKYQAALQSPPVLIAIAILFVLLSLSMFGMYELQLPSRWQEKLTGLSNKQQGGKLGGVFVMGVLSGLVASPCTTAPLSAVLVYVAQSGDLLQGFVTLYVLSMGMGLPLLLIGTSGGKLLPRAGAWMNIIKHIFGFLLIMVAIIMLGRIWPGLVSDLLWSLWAICFVGYLLHQNKLTPVSWKHTSREVVLLLALLGSFSYGLQAVMGYLGYSVSNHAATSEQHGGFNTIKTLPEFQAALAQAKAEGKPVMLDLYADWCVACKEFANITFKDAAVASRMSNLVLLKADVTAMDDEDQALLDAYNVLGLPTLLFVDADGELRDDLRVTGFMGPTEFANHLDHLLPQ